MDVRSCKLPSFISDAFYWGPAGMRRPVPRNGTDRWNRGAACSHGKESDGLWGYGFGKPTGRQVKTLPERCVLQEFREILIKYRIAFLAGGGAPWSRWILFGRFLLRMRLAVTGSCRAGRRQGRRWPFNRKLTGSRRLSFSIVSRRERADG